MTETAVKTDLKSILPLRGLFLQETNFQISTTQFMNAGGAILIC
jgi:hypothetical protein